MYFATLGFEERFILRDLVERGIKGSTTVIIFISKSEEENVKQKIEKAYEILKSVLEKLPGISINKIEIDLKRDAYENIFTLTKILYEAKLKENNIIINLSGGQRILIIYLLIAIINANINSKIVLHSEDGSIAINIPSILLLPFEIDSVDKEILKYAKEKKS